MTEQSELKRIKKMSEDELDEHIFETENLMVEEYINGCGRKDLIKYWQALSDQRTK